MLGWHLLEDDWRATMATPRQKPWKIGDKRSARGSIELCRNGYHFCKTIIGVIKNGFGGVLCRVEVDDDAHYSDSLDKGVSRRRRLITGADCNAIFNEFAVMCKQYFIDYLGADELSLAARARLDRINFYDNAPRRDGRRSAAGVYTEVYYGMRYEDRPVFTEYCEKWLEKRVNDRLSLTNG